MPTKDSFKAEIPREEHRIVLRRWGSAEVYFGLRRSSFLFHESPPKRLNTQQSTQGNAGDTIAIELLLLY